MGGWEPRTGAVSSSNPESRCDDDPRKLVTSPEPGTQMCLCMKESVSKAALGPGFQVPLVHPQTSVLYPPSHNIGLLSWLFLRPLIMNPRSGLAYCLSIFSTQHHVWPTVGPDILKGWMKGPTFHSFMAANWRSKTRHPSSLLWSEVQSCSFLLLYVIPGSMRRV